MRKFISVILILIFIFIAAFAGYQIFREHTERQESAESYADLEELISFPEVPPSEETDETFSSESGETELNKRCNEAIGEGMTEIILTSEELPVKESWPAICKQLMENGLDDVKCIPQGIKINLTQ